MIFRFIFEYITFSSVLDILYPEFSSLLLNVRFVLFFLRVDHGRLPHCLHSLNQQKGRREALKRSLVAPSGNP